MMSAIMTNWRKIAIAITLISTLGYTLVFLPEDTFLWLAKEDGILEWAGTLFFLATSVFLLLLFFRNNSFAKKEDASMYNTYGKRIWFLLLGLLFFFLFGEEISWGQRIFGLETPEGLSAINKQKELNFHNLGPMHLYDDEGNRKTGLALHLTAKRIFIYIFTLYLFVLPLCVKYIPAIAILARRFYLPVPKIELGFMFLANVVLYSVFRPFGSHELLAGRAVSEVQEMNFALVLFFIPFVWYGSRR
jgi:hypothetical protein